jgi:hypothetical protein
MGCKKQGAKNKVIVIQKEKRPGLAWTYHQLPLRQWGTSNVYLLVLSSWKVNIAER